MNSHSSTDKSIDARLTEAAARTLDTLDEPWFDEPAPSSQRRPSAPPVVHVGEFLGDPEVDGWLR